MQISPQSAQRPGEKGWLVPPKVASESMLGRPTIVNGRHVPQPESNRRGTWWAIYTANSGTCCICWRCAGILQQHCFESSISGDFRGFRVGRRRSGGPLTLFSEFDCMLVKVRMMEKPPQSVHPSHHPGKNCSKLRARLKLVIRNHHLRLIEYVLESQV